jgi:hypothetical protein
MLIISGDNWYPNKTNDYKLYFVNVLQSGLLQIYDLHKECHLVLGNHDEDNDGKHIDMIAKQNCMLKTQAYYVNAINKNKSNITVPTLDDLQIYEKQLKKSLSIKSRTITPNKPMIILHESKDTVDFRLTDDGNLFIFINTNKFYTDDKTVIYRYIDMIVETLKINHTGTKNIFIVGHVPITSMKIKNKKIKITKIHDDIEIMDYLISAIDQYKPIYLCADTHNFEVTSISNIVQIVVGTGGADPDILTFASNELNYHIFDKYKVNGYYHNAFGYSIINIDDDTNDITVTYKHILESGETPAYVHKQYDYKLRRTFVVQDIKEIPELENEKIEKIQKDMQGICSNMITENIVKNNEIYCYQKAKI